jgi:hypothetical protein
MRRLAKDWEKLNSKALAFLRLASIRHMLGKLCIPHKLFGQTLSPDIIRRPLSLRQEVTVVLLM